MMSTSAATALSFSLATLVLLWFLVFELLPDFAADFRRYKHDDRPKTR